MSIIKRNWTSETADDWTKEDWIAIILSSLSYFLLTIGTALSFLLLPSGFIVLAVGIIVTLLMYI